MAAHLQPGGILLLEPWFTPQEWRSGTVHAQFVNEPELKIARINTSATEGSVSLMEMHYVIGTPSGTEHFVERHELGLFEHSQIENALNAANCAVSYFPDAPGGRGLFLGKKR
jgi:hypothetical protein